MIIEGMELKALQLEQENPYTMVRVSHTTNGVTYEARGWALWDGQQKWSNWEGQRIAVIRAKRKIARRLRWEAELYQQMLDALSVRQAAANAHIDAYVALRDIGELHADGGTVQL